MEVEIFTLADYAVDPGNGKLFICGTFDTLNAPTFPIVHATASVVAKIRVGNSEAGKHKIEIRAFDPTGKDLHPPLTADTDVKPNSAGYTSLNIIWNLLNTKIETEGVYAFEFLFDGEFASGLRLTVMKSKPA